MPLRPFHLPRSLARPRTTPWPPRSRSHAHAHVHPQRPFHSTPPVHAATTPTHYDTLDLSSMASPTEIKRQFYALSKKHHPDRNQNDPNASTRFVAISEAYHVLSVPEKRAQYDASLSTAAPTSWGGSAAGSTAGGPGYPQGSYSSASFGARPASGLNKKRSTFRGPPPSFYKAGGYGEFGAKRSQYAYQTEHQEPQGQEPHSHSQGGFGGFGPGQQCHGNQVPHFDDRRHKETHDNVYAHIWARRRQTRRTVRPEQDYERGSVLINFLAISGVISIIGATAHVFGNQQGAGRSDKSQDGA